MPRINITDRRNTKDVRFYSVFRDKYLKIEGWRLSSDEGELTETFFLSGLMDDFVINFNLEYECLEFATQLSQLLLQDDTIEITIRAFNVNEICISGDQF